MLEAASLLKKREDELKQRILDLLEAIKKVEKGGCLDHLDCWPGAEKEWYAPIARARAAAQGTEKPCKCKEDKKDCEEDEDCDEDDEYYEYYEEYEEYQ